MTASSHTHIPATREQPTGVRREYRTRLVQKKTAHKALLASSAALLAVTLTGCAVANDAQSSDTKNADDSLGTVTLVVHDSFPNDEFERAASAATGYNVKVLSAGDGGELTNKLVLTQGAPIADAFFGVDNVYASRLIDAGVAAPYVSEDLPTNATEYLADESDMLSPITRGATCINIDPAWFADAGIPEPTSYQDLADPSYAELTVLLDPSSSSTGASFLMGTIAEFGEDGFTEYWSELQAGGARIEQSWSAAYNGQFTQGGGDGSYPIVLSYSSSPAWTVNEAGTESSTAALLETCSSQVEYAGVLEGAADPAGAQAVVDYLLSAEFQDTIAESMFVYPVSETAFVPEAWQLFAPLPQNPRDVTPIEIGEGREAWLRAWSDATGW